MKLFIAAGGTGGHVYPALSVAEEFMDRDPKHWVLFITSRRGMENQVIARAEFIKNNQSAQCQVKSIAVLKLARKWSFALFLTPLFAGFAFLQCLALILQHRPQAIFITGGFVGLPLAVAGYVLRLPVFVHEQNAIPGLTNKLCGFFARRIFLSFPKSQAYFPANKTVVTGNPVRRAILQVDPALAGQQLQLDGNATKVLVWGGSQGARAINQAVLNIVKRGIPPEFEIIHLVGERDFSDYLLQLNPKINPQGYTAVQRLHTFPQFPRYFITDYLDNVASVLAAADLVVGRAGATGMAEIIALGKPSILIPFPYAANQHQYKNAEAAAAAGAALILDEKNLTGEILWQKIFQLVLEHKLSKMSFCARQLKFAGSSNNIVDIICQSV